MMFQAQHNRRFILAVAICQLKAYFNVFDRVGMVHSVALDMITEHTKFLRKIGRASCRERVLMPV